MREPRSKCKKLREEIMNIWQRCFKEKLGPLGCMNIPPVKLRLKYENARPSFCTRSYDTLYHHREMYEREIKSSLDASYIISCGTERSE